MKRTTKVLATAAVALMTALPLGAQPAPRGQPGLRGPASGGAEFILRMRERLELSDQQVADIEAMRQEMLQERTREMAAWMEMRSRARAGDVDPEEFREAREARREAIAEQRDRHRQRIEEVLTEEQRTELQGMARREMMNRGDGPGSRGRPGMRQGRGFRGGPGWDGPRRRPGGPSGSP